MLKSRIIAKKYRDEGAINISTKSPTISDDTQRLTMALASADPRFDPYNRHISQN